MVSPNEANFDLREIEPMSRNILHTEVWKATHTGQRTNQRIVVCINGCQDWRPASTSPKVSTGYLNYPVDVRDTAKSGMGRAGNRRLNYLVEFIFVNVGDPHRDAKASSLPMSGVGVGGVIVVRGWENQPQGEGRQLFGISTQSTQMGTGRNLP
jgi:hypothetical protein